MSANSENPENSRKSGASQDGGTQGEAGQERDFESGLDYGAFAEEEAVFPEDRLDAASASSSTPVVQPEKNGTTSESETVPVSSAAEDSTSTRKFAGWLNSPDSAETQALPGQADRVAESASDQQATTVVPRAGAEQPTRSLNDANQTPQSAPAPAVTPSSPSAPSPEAVSATSPVYPTPAAVPGPLSATEETSTFAPYNAQHSSGGGSVGEEITDQDLEEEIEKDKRGISRFFQVLLAIFVPVLVIAAAVRIVASPVALWLAYNRPGFPSDAYGFSDGDRLLYGSYGVDYLFNFANSRYLAELSVNGSELFTADEVSHMTDVKFVMMWVMLISAIILVLVLLMGLMLRAWRPGGFVRGLFAGAWVLLVAVAGLVTLAILNWQMFFEEFHRIFFAEGTWTFAPDSTLIRLYPEQFWIDAGIALGALILLIALVLLMTTWPTRRRRERRAARLAEVKDRRREKLIAELSKGSEA